MHFSTKQEEVNQRNKPVGEVFKMKNKNQEGYCKCGLLRKRKIVRTHGKKSRGYKVCRLCKKLIK